MATDQPQTEGSPGTTLVRLSSLPSWSVEAAFWATLTLLTAAAGMARSRGLAPHTLWYDDLWVAALTRLPFWEATTTPTPVPPAFVAGSWILTRIVAGKELALQVIPFSASLLAIIVTGLLVRSATRSRAIGVLAAALAVFNPAMTHYAIFVKQYTSEYLFVALLLALVAREAQRDSEGVSWTLVICAAFACMVGFGTIVVAAVVVNVVFADSVWRARVAGRPGGRMFGVAAGFNIALLGYYAVVLRARVDPGLENYWGRYFIPRESVASALHHIENVSFDALRAAFPERLEWLVWLVPVGLAWLLWSRRSRVLGFVVAGIMTALLGLSALRAYPLGGGRTDMFLFPLVILTAAVGAHAMVRALPGARPLRVLVAVLVAGFTLFNAPGEAYFDLDLSNFVRTMDRRARPAHGIVVYPSANSLTAFYTTMPIRLSASDGAAPFFAFGRLRTVPLSTTGPLVAHRQLVAFLAQEDYPRIWFIATRVTEAYPLEPLIEVIRARGYRVRKQWNSRIKTQLILFEREN